MFKLFRALLIPGWIVTTLLVVAAFGINLFSVAVILGSLLLVMWNFV